VATDVDPLKPGDLVVGWYPPTDPRSPVGPYTPGIVVRVHQIKLMDNSETQEVWILREGREERWLGSELLLVDRP
jgi:hypothetical protein